MPPEDTAVAIPLEQALGLTVPAEGWPVIPGVPQWRSTYLDYMPGIYDGSDFLGRFLLIFESILGPLDRTVGNIHHYFDPDDAWDLRLLAPAERPWKFYDIWTTTEAQLKASGIGMAEGWKVPDPERWAIHKFAPASGYAAALAVGGGEFKLGCWSWTP